MRGFGVRGAAAAVAALGLMVMVAPPTRAETSHELAAAASGTLAASPPAVTFSFELTINGTPPATDGFQVKWGETGIDFCGPCVGGGHTYLRTMTFPQGVTETFTFVRTSGNVTPDHPGQTFATQTATATADHTISATFTYAVSTPSTGSAPALGVGAALVGTGAAVTGVMLRRRRRMTPRQS